MAQAAVRSRVVVLLVLMHCIMLIALFVGVLCLVLILLYITSLRSF